VVSLYCQASKHEIGMRIIVAMTGATGAVYGIRILAALQELGVERHLILSRWAEVTVTKETALSVREVCAMASVVHSRDNQGALIASGSFRHDGMIIAPCSMKTLAAIRLGYADGLIPRRCLAEGAAAPGAAGARDAAERYSSRKHADVEPNGCGHRAASAGLL
jgi:phosphopantothenoylcysteine synthetase/decarboxylase